MTQVYPQKTHSAYYTKAKDNSSDVSSEASSQYKDNKEADDRELSADANMAKPIKKPKPTCQTCNVRFPSNNQLHIHLKDTGYSKGKMNQKMPKGNTKASSTEIPHQVDKARPLIKLTSKPFKNLGLDFRPYNYVTLKVALQSDGEVNNICKDSKYTMSLINREFLKQQVPKAKIHKTVLIRVRGLGKSNYQCTKFIKIHLFISGELNRKPATAKVLWEIHIVN